MRVLHSELSNLYYASDLGLLDRFHQRHRRADRAVGPVVPAAGSNRYGCAPRISTASWSLSSSLGSSPGELPSSEEPEPLSDGCIISSSILCSSQELSLLLSGLSAIFGDDYTDSTDVLFAQYTTLFYVHVQVYRYALDV